MKLAEKETSLRLRKQGYSLKEISRQLNVSKGTVSLWVRDLTLSEKAKLRIIEKIQKGRYVSAERKKERTRILAETLKENAAQELKNIQLSLVVKRLLCAMIYWCEGAKDYHGGISFTNSDPYLTRLFIKLLIEGHGVDRKKFVARLHLHEYHQVKKQEKFWQDILQLKPSQFRQAYLKPHTGKRYRDNYPGCIALRYYDSILARELMFLAQSFTGGVVQW